MNLSIQNVSKQYRRDFWGLRSFTLDLGEGVLGLLGPNGAGKSTLMRILATVMQGTEGMVTWTGNSHTVDIAKKPDELRQVLGYLPQDFGIYPHLNAIEFLEYLAAIKGLDGRTARRRIDALLQVRVADKRSFNGKRQEAVATGAVQIFPWQIGELGNIAQAETNTQARAWVISFIQAAAQAIADFTRKDSLEQAPTKLPHDSHFRGTGSAHPSFPLTDA